jgi:hypothetical protein
MAALGFKKCFAPLVKSGVKQTTIRLTHKHPIKPGDALHLYTGMRTKNCSKLLDTVCKEVLPIVIMLDERAVYLKRDGRSMAQLTDDEIVSLAMTEGFPCPDEFFSFFSHYYGKQSPVFEGVWIKW